MGETRELIGERVGEADSSTSPEGRVPSPIELPSFLKEESAGLEILGGSVLEWCLESLDFERGFLLSLDTDSRDESASWRVVVSRARVDGSSWAEVRGRDYVIDRSIVQRALATREPLELDASLVRLEGGEPGEKRNVLVRSFELSDVVRAVLYLDRPLPLDGVDGSELRIFECLAGLCAPVLSRARLREEVAELRRTIAAAGEERGAPGSSREDEGEGEPTTEAEPPPFHGIVGRDEKLQKIFRVIEKVKDSDLNVCIFGESGTGKELIARAMHESGNRRDRLFVSENCGAIAENLLESELFGHMRGAFTGADEDKKGLFELADGGTLFLDEIGDTSEGMQRKLLRTLEEGTVRPIGSKKSIRVDVRVVCASNRDLKHLVREGTFRADLFYRLNVIQIHVPPLRERRDDIPLLIDYFTEEFSRTEGVRKRFGESAVRALMQYTWPGNVRELRNVLRRVLLTSPGRTVARKDVLPYLSSAQTTACLGENLERDDRDLILRIPLRQHFNDIIEECERLVLLNALKENGWNKSRVTKALGIPRQSLYNKIAKYDLQPETSLAGEERS